MLHNNIFSNVNNTCTNCKPYGLPIMSWEIDLQSMDEEIILLVNMHSHTHRICLSTEYKTYIYIYG